jgi:DNA-binding transcriptional MerR regulator
MKNKNNTTRHKENIINLRSKGYTYNEIQKELGCSKGTISYHLGENQIEKTRQRSEKRREEVRQRLAEIKEKVGCMDCNTKFPYYVLDFDHVRGKKVDNISKMVKWYKYDDIIEETKKCDVVCSNCHRIRTFSRKNSLLKSKYEINNK